MSVIQFRKAANIAPLDAVLAESGRRGVRVASPDCISAPSDSPQEVQARPFDLPRFLHASESLSETLLRQRNDMIFWNGWATGFTFGVLVISIIALLRWPG